MSNTTNALGHSITITGIPATRSFDTRQNVKKRLFSFRFNSGIPNSGVNMAYASVDEIHADNNLFISDKSTFVNENSPGFLIEEETFIGPSYTTFFKNFLLTDVFTPTEITRPSEPLYFRHILASSIDENSISILDKNFNSIDGNLYVIERPYTYSIVDGQPNNGSDGDHILEYEAVYVYNNLEHSLDEDTGDYEIYYVSYVNATTGNVVNELLSNQNVFSQAEFDDIWAVTSQLKPWGKAYLIEENNGTYELTLPTTGIYSINSIDSARVFITEPVTKESIDSWFVRVTNGSFRTTYNTLLYQYSMPEFSAQNFNPIEPYKLIVNEKSTRINSHLIKLNHNDIQYSELLHFYIDVVITDESDNPLFAITTDPDRIGTNYIDSVGNVLDIMWNSELFESLDARNGFIYLSTIIKDTYNIITTYYFQEKYYEFTMINFNPTQNSNILTERVVLYLVPENSIHNENTAHTSALHFLKVAPDGLITFTSQDGSGGNENLKTGLQYMIEAGSRHSTKPGGLSHIFWVNSPEINIGMYYDAIPALAPNATSSSNPAGVAHIFAVYPKPGPATETFVDKFTVNARVGQEGLNKRYVVLGEIFVNNHTSPDDVKILDTRVRGGGVRKDRLEEALLKNPEVQWYNDIGVFDGRPFPGTSAVVVKVPYLVLDEYGGLLSQKQVREIVKRHMALGSEPIIRYYGVVPNLISIVPDENKLTIQWDSEGMLYKYNIYYSTSKEGPYVKYNSSLIVDNASGNILEITGLTNKVKYWVTATAVNIAGSIEGPRAVALIARPEVISKKLKAVMGHSVSVVI